MDDCQGRTAENIGRCIWVPGKCCIQFIENAFSCHKYFSGTALFCRASQVNNGSGNFRMVFQIIFYGNCASHACSSKTVVSAAMSVSARCHSAFFCHAAPLAKTSQRIIFSQDSDHRTSASISSTKCGRDSGNSSFYCKSFFFQNIGEFLAGTVFPETGLRIFPDMIGCLNVLFFFIFDRLKKFLFFCHIRSPFPLLQQQGQKIFAPDFKYIFMQTALRSDPPQWQILSLNCRCRSTPVWCVLFRPGKGR